MKRRQIVSLLVIIVLTMQSFAFAEPSNWAVELVGLSENEGLVPEKLQMDYQTSIRRFEYVLLALEVLEHNGVDVEIVNAKPFTDINGHPYEDEIIKAFNANIVGGYEDQTFRPNQDISREEVSALVYNLVKKINDETLLPTTTSTYSDSAKISPWAKTFVEFNYQNKIMSGTGKVNGLDTIDPQGKASREQAIILLYNVASNNDLLHAAYDSLVVSGFGETKTPEQIFETAQKLGFNTMDKAVYLVKNTDAEFLFMTDSNFTILYKDTSAVEVIDNKYDKSVVLKLSDLDNGVPIDHYLMFVESMFSDQTFETMVNSAIADFRLDKGYVLNTPVNGNGVVSMYSENDNNVLYYFVRYTKSK